MKTFIAFLLVTFSATELSRAAECPLKGVWKSDAAKTLADIAATNAMSDRAASALSDNTYGHMTHEWTCTDVRAGFDGISAPNQCPIAFRK